MQGGQTSHDERNMLRRDQRLLLSSRISSLRASHFVVGACIKIVMSTAMKVTEAIICAPGAFMPSNKPARAAGMTPVSRVQHMNSISLKLHLARPSGSAHKKTVT